MGSMDYGYILVTLLIEHGIITREEWKRAYNKWYRIVEGLPAENGPTAEIEESRAVADDKSRYPNRANDWGEYVEMLDNWRENVLQDAVQTLEQIAGLERQAQALREHADKAERLAGLMAIHIEDAKRHAERYGGMAQSGMATETGPA